MLGDNPDALYFISAVSAGHEYVVRGCKSGEVYLSFSVHQQPEGTAFPRVISDINDANMTFDRKGCYHLVLTAGDSAPDGSRRRLLATASRRGRVPDLAALF